MLDVAYKGHCQSKKLNVFLVIVFVELQTESEKEKVFYFGDCFGKKFSICI